MALSDIINRHIIQRAKKKISNSMDYETYLKIRFMIAYRTLDTQDFNDSPLIFIHIPRCAGVSIDHYLKEHKVRAVVLGHNKRNPNYRYPYEISEKNNPDAYCVVRNPFDRLVSAYFFLENAGINQEDKADFEGLIKEYGNFENFVKYGLGNTSARPELLEQIHLAPQSTWITDEDGDLCLDQRNILRFENLEYDFRRFLELTANIPHELPKKNQSKKNGKSWREMYRKPDGSIDDEMVRIVSETYRKDFELFGYNTCISAEESMQVPLRYDLPVYFISIRDHP